MTASPTSSVSGALRLVAVAFWIWLQLLLLLLQLLSAMLVQVVEVGESVVGVMRVFLVGRDSKTVGPGRHGGRGLEAGLGFMFLLTCGSAGIVVCGCGG